MIYLDSAATTLEKPAAVRCAMARAVNAMSSPGRGSHRATRLAEEMDYTCRTAAAELAGWTDIPATVMAVNDQRAISIAIATNLLRRQDLTIIERGKAYKALLDARNRHGFRTDLTSGESRQKYSARGIVAEFFGVTEYEIRKAVKLAQLIPSIAEIVENEPKKLNLTCADLIADYDETAQTAFIEMCQIDGYALNKQTMAFIQAQCPPPSADQQAIYAAWRKARAKASQ